MTDRVSKRRGKVWSIEIVTPVVCIASCVLGPTGPITVDPNRDPYASLRLDSTPNSQDTWAQLEAAARIDAADVGGLVFETSEAVRLEGKGDHVEHDLQVDEGHCYSVGVAWSYAGSAMLRVVYGRSDAGEAVNDNLGSVGFELGRDPPMFCADHSGPVTLSIRGLTPNGHQAMDSLLEYAIVVGNRPESKVDASARKARERSGIAERNAEVENNLAEAAAAKAARKTERCNRCRDSYRACQVRRAAYRQNPPPGLSQAPNCEAEFEDCGQSSEEGKEYRDKPCGDPPR